MDRALGIVEVVEMICEELGTEDSELGTEFDLNLLSPKWRCDLARLARTSTIFLHPALNVLWRHQGTILNLLRCMPSDVWDIKITRPHEEELDFPIPLDLKVVLRRPVTPVDFQRCLLYSHRIKSFNADEQHFVQPGSQVYETIDTCFPEKPIFPNLQNLSWWSPINPDSFHYVRLFISPRIIHLNMNFGRGEHLSALRILSSQCPGLKNVTFLFSDQSAPEVSKFLCTLHHIENLEIVGKLDTAALAHIAHLHGLQSLSLTQSSMPSTGSPTSFPALRCLKYPSMKHAPRFFELLKRCSLVELSIQELGLTSKEISRQFYSALAALDCSHSSLKKIFVARYSDWTIPVEERGIYLFGGDILCPLFAFTNLIDVSLSHPVGMDLDDVLVREMARAWPRIESLELPPARFHRIHPHVTLHGIYAFAQHCPRLRMLHLAFDATAVPEIQVGTNEKVSQRSLDKLNVAHSPIRESTLVAKFLSKIFPELDTIRTLYSQLAAWRFDPELEAFHKIWKQVEAALPGAGVEEEESELNF
ncbi:hypothetical protein C8R45DRAFT_934823 [Mycena sanguinolenta]|nr:hypothetical protein C8R45DRAFT_934823 [Mycena sanguinolenta]